MGTIINWQRVWAPLTAHRRVTAMDRRGRGSSGDADTYELSSSAHCWSPPGWATRPSTH